MAKAKIETTPDTKTLLTLMREYTHMLHDAEHAAKRILALNPQTEKFWDELSGSAHLFTLVEARSNTIWDEIVNVIDQLPED